MNKKTSCIYARVSSTTNRQDTDRQVEDLRRLAECRELTVERVFTEKASGAKRRKDRPVLNECLLYCVKNKIDTLLISELSRLGRNAEDVLQNVMFCKQNNLNVYFQKEQLSIFTDDGTPHPFLMIFISVLGTIAEMERETIYYRMKSGYDKHRRDGGKVGRKPGYRKTVDDYERDYPAVCKELRRPNRESYARIAKLCDCSLTTVRTIDRMLNPKPDPDPDPAEQKSED